VSQKAPVIIRSESDKRATCAGKHTETAEYNKGERVTGDPFTKTTKDHEKTAEEEVGTDARRAISFTSTAPGHVSTLA